VTRGPRWLLYLATVGVVLSFAKLHAARVGHYEIVETGRLPWLLAFTGILLLAAYGAGLPDLAGRRGSRSALPASLAATTGSTAVISLLQMLDGGAHLPRFVVFASAAVLTPTYAAIALLAHGGRQRTEERERIVVVAEDGEAEVLTAELERCAERPALVVGAFSGLDARHDYPASQPLLELVRRTRATVVVLDLDAQAEPDVVAQAAELHAEGVRVRTLEAFYDEWLGKLPHGELERLSLMFDIQELHNRLYGRMKRLMDFTAGLGAFVVLGAVLPVVAVANRLGRNKGPLFFSQPRTGKNGKTFPILKFRTMVPSANAAGTWTADDDPRITPVGKWLRRTHIDEIPQAINLLRGDISLVGPRPEQPHYVEDLCEKIPFYSLRHTVRPGLTGWAQVKYPYGASDFDALEKLQFEFFYLRHQSLWLDVRIVVRTIRGVLGRTGR
jgi:exopolysaccharide biosynthesis polyprenyl glycosylphosphotransferase